MATKPTKTTKKPATQAPKSSITQAKAKPPVKAAGKATVSSSVKVAKSTTPSRSAKTAPAVSAAVPETLQPTASTLLRPGSKQSQLLELLQSKGATIPQMSELTGWQAHTIRATMSAVFRKRLGLTIEASKVEGSTGRMYRVTGQAAA